MYFFFLSRLLQNMGIKDEFHQKNILVCIEELCRPSSLPALPGSLPDNSTNKSQLTINNDNTCTNNSNVGDHTSLSSSSSSSSSVALAGTTNNPVNNQKHNLVPHSFSVLERCDKCHKYLRGLLHQGFLCQGIIISINMWSTGIQKYSARMSNNITFFGYIYNMSITELPHFIIIFFFLQIVVWSPTERAQQRVCPRLAYHLTKRVVLTDWLQVR